MGVCPTLYDGRIVYRVSRDLTSTAGQEDPYYIYRCVCVGGCDTATVVYGREELAVLCASRSSLDPMTVHC